MKLQRTIFKTVFAGLLVLLLEGCETYSLSQYGLNMPLANGSNGLQAGVHYGVDGEGIGTIYTWDSAKILCANLQGNFVGHQYTLAEKKGSFQPSDLDGNIEAGYHWNLKTAKTWKGVEVLGGLGYGDVSVKETDQQYRIWGMPASAYDFNGRYGEIYLQTDLGWSSHRFRYGVGLQVKDAYFMGHDHITFTDQDPYYPDSTTYLSLDIKSNRVFIEPAFLAGYTLDLFEFRVSLGYSGLLLDNGVIQQADIPLGEHLYIAVGATVNIFRN